MLVFSIIFSSCKSGKDIIEKKMFKCINESINLYDNNTNSKGNFYTMIKDVEREFILSKRLNKITKEGYNEMINNLLLKKESNSKELYTEVCSIFENYEYLLGVNNIKIFNQCPFFVLITEKNEMNSSLFLQSQLLNQILFQQHILYTLHH